MGGLLEGYGRVGSSHEESFDHLSEEFFDHFEESFDHFEESFDHFEESRRN